MFESPYIKINEHGIDMKRNYQLIEHIEYSEVNTIMFKKGHLINNWILSLILSILLTGFSFIWGLKSTTTFETHSLLYPWYNELYFYIAFQLFIPWLLFVGGSIWIYSAVKLSPIILINTAQKRYKIALEEFKENDTLNSLIDFLAERVELIRQYKD